MGWHKGQTNSGSFTKGSKKASEAGRKSKRTKDPVREAIKEKTLTEIHEIWEAVSGLSPLELKKYLDHIEEEMTGGARKSSTKKKQKISSIEALFVSSFARGIQTGDFSKVSGMLDRITGKPSVKIQHEIEEELSDEDFEKLDDIFQKYQKTKGVPVKLPPSGGSGVPKK